MSLFETPAFIEFLCFAYYPQITNPCKGARLSFAWALPESPLFPVLLYREIKARQVKIMSIALRETEKLLLDLPLESPCYSVGGAPRDALLGRDYSDLDLAVEEKHGSKKLAGRLRRLFPKETSRPFNAGCLYPVWKMTFKEDVRFKGKTYRTAGASLDLSDTQKEDCSFGSLKDDMKRRDFTINMLAKDLGSGETLDPSGKGFQHLKAGVIETHPEVQAKAVFKGDPLRIIRLFRFSSALGFAISKNAMETAKELSFLLKDVSPERVREEIVKVCKEGKLAQFIRECEDAGVLKHFLPEVKNLKGVEQDVYYHSEGDVFTHTLMVVEKAQKGALPQIAALLHDIAKPETKEVVPQGGKPPRIKFLKHEIAGAEKARESLARLRFDNKFIQKIEKLIRNHLRAGTASKWSDKAVRKFIRDMGEDLEDVLHLTEIDLLSAWGPEGKPRANPIPALRERIQKAKEIPIKSAPILGGKEIMQKFNIPSGPKIGELLKELQDFEDELAAQGRAPSKEEAFNFLEKRIKARNLHTSD